MKTSIGWVVVVAAARNSRYRQSRSLLRPLFNEAVPKLQSCYEAKRATLPSLPKGTVVTEFQIDLGGAPRGTTASGLDVDVAGCVAKVVGGIAFPKPKSGPVTVTYRINFDPLSLTNL